MSYFPDIVPFFSFRTLFYGALFRPSIAYHAGKSLKFQKKFEFSNLFLEISKQSSKLPKSLKIQTFVEISKKSLKIQTFLKISNKKFENSIQNKVQTYQKVWKFKLFLKFQKKVWKFKLFGNFQIKSLKIQIFSATHAIDGLMRLRYCLLGVFRFSNGTFSRQLSGFHSFQNQLSVFRRH